MFYLVMGFASVWVLVTVYLIYVGLRQRRIEEEMVALREQIEQEQKPQQK
jgi:CcmD family protein